jgi:hypothetical protein
MLASKVCASLLFFSFLLPGVAAAQTEQEGSAVTRERSSSFRITSEEGSSFTAIFEDDPLTALVNGGDVPRIRVRAIRTSGYLIRPRTQFVPELLKSVERL